MICCMAAMFDLLCFDWKQQVFFAVPGGRWLKSRFAFLLTEHHGSPSHRGLQGVVSKPPLGTQKMFEVQRNATKMRNLIPRLCLSIPIAGLKHAHWNASKLTLTSTVDSDIRIHPTSPTCSSSVTYEC